jgi:ketosteroid isomerase-like protein
MSEIDRAGLKASKEANTETVGEEKSSRWWEHEDAPAGSTSASLAVVENGRKTRVHGPTHYHHLADGRVVAGYTTGTHHVEPGEDGQDRVTKILSIFEG